LNQTPVTVISFFVSVPVLSEQIMDVDPASPRTETPISTGPQRHIAGCQRKQRDCRGTATLRYIRNNNDQEAIDKELDNVVRALASAGTRLQRKHRAAMVTATMAMSLESCGLPSATTRCSVSDASMAMATDRRLVSCAHNQSDCHTVKQ
jgi:hypothetical protein